MGPPFENGGGSELDDCVRLLGIASMGPPFENGGGKLHEENLGDATALQWGRRSKTAEGTFARASGGSFRNALQWGRRSKTAEGQVVGSRLGGRQVRLQWGRRSKTAEGVRPADRDAIEGDTASMGPPFENGGGLTGGLPRPDRQ